jgi:glyoxylase-like metal-dependent hydrolase (beta-lactamase superfamily II)
MENLKWQVGEISVTRLLDGEGSTRPAGGERDLLPLAFPEAIREIPWMAPDWADEKGHLHFSLHALLVETPSFRLVVDTCIGNDKQRSFEGMSNRNTSFLDDLAATGWSRHDVDGVICTHLHVGHVGWNTILEGGRWKPTFPKARYFIARTEFDHWQAEYETASSSSNAMLADNNACFADSVKPLIDAGLHKLVDTDAVIAPGIRLMPTPGHTPGHVSVVLESAGERAVITGDLMHHPCQIAHPEWSSIADTAPETSQASRLAFLDQFADTQTLVIGTHFGGPTAGCVVRDSRGYWLDGRGRALDYRAGVLGSV